MNARQCFPVIFNGYFKAYQERVLIHVVDIIVSQQYDFHSLITLNDTLKIIIDNKLEKMYAYFQSLSSISVLYMNTTSK